MNTNWTTETKSSSFQVGNTVDAAIEKASKDRIESLKTIELRSYGDDKVIAISEPKLKATLTKVGLIQDKMDALFKDLDESINDISYFNCSATQSLSKDLNDVSINIPIIKNNLISYVTDLTLVMKNFGEVSVKNINMIRKEKDKIPSIEAYKEKE